MQPAFVRLHLFALDFIICFAPCRGGALLRPYKLPRKKVKSIRISTASSIDGNRSTATSIKSDIPVSGGAYQDARKVTIEWNDI